MNTIAYANRENAVCESCNKDFWPSSKLTRICNSCKSQARHTVSRETEDTRNAISLIGFWFAPVLILGISSKVGMIIHSAIPEILPIIPLMVGFVIATWIVLAQWTFSRVSE